MKGTSQTQTLTTGPASDASTSPARQRSSRRWEAILPRTSGPLWRLLRTWVFYTHFSQARLRIPANPTPNLLILIIDLVNKRRISNPLKYEPCLERLVHSTLALWNILNRPFDQLEDQTQNNLKKTKIFCTLLGWMQQHSGDYFSPLPISMHVFHFLYIFSFILDDRYML